jgi:hypothetical protein
MENFEKGAVKSPENQEKTESKEQPEFIQAENIKPEILADIKREDAGSLKAAEAEIKNFSQEKQGEVGNEKLIQLATQKLDEIQAEVESRKKGFFNKMLYGEKDFALAEMAIKKARERVASGNFDMHTIVDSESLRKFAHNIDVSEFPERKDKKYSGSTSVGTQTMSKF